MGHGKNQKQTTKKSMHIPPRWKDKCEKDYHWCAQLSDSLTVAEKMEKLNCGKTLNRVGEPAVSTTRAECRDEFPNDETKEEECFKAWVLMMSTLKCHPPPPLRHAKRAGNLAPDKSDSGLTICLCLGALFSIILVGVLLYCFFFREQKQTSGQKAKGASKGASQMGKSKLGKSKLGSRKSSQRTSRNASKRSKGPKSRLSAKK